jgi:xylulokinase
MSGVVLALDLGTSSLKAALVPTSGGVLAMASDDLTTTRPATGAAEQDPASWWSATATAVRQLRAAVHPWPDVRAIAVTGQMHGVVLRGADGRVLRPCLTWADERGGRHLHEMATAVDPAEVMRITANPLAAGMSAAKLVWLLRAEPDVWRATRSVLLPKDELRARLTGERATDPSDASGTLLFDVDRQTWSDRLADAWEIDPSVLPPIVPSAADAGQLTSAAGAELGLPPAIPVVTGAGDTTTAALGMGVADPNGTGFLGLGTAAQLLVPTVSPVRDARQRINVIRHATPAGWCAMAATLDGGGALAWLAQLLGLRAGAVDALLAEAEAADPEHGITFISHLSGERTPGMDPSARASFHGLTAAHGRAELARSVLEGVAFALREGLDTLTDLGVAPRTLRMGGGGGQSLVWPRILADVLGRPITLATWPNASLLGAARLADHGVTSVPAGPDEVTVNPDSARQRAADGRYGRYLTLRHEDRLVTSTDGREGQDDY